MCTGVRWPERAINLTLMSSTLQGTCDAAVPSNIKKRSRIYERHRFQLCGLGVLNKRQRLAGSTLGAELTLEGIQKIKNITLTPSLRLQWLWNWYNNNKYATCPYQVITCYIEILSYYFNLISHHCMFVIWDNEIIMLIHGNNEILNKK